MIGRYNDFLGMVRKQYLSQGHSPDPTGKNGEEIALEIKLCMDFLYYEEQYREMNTNLGKRKRKRLF